MTRSTTRLEDVGQGNEKEVHGILTTAIEKERHGEEEVFKAREKEPENATKVTGQTGDSTCISGLEDGKEVTRPDGKEEDKNTRETISTEDLVARITRLNEGNTNWTHNKWWRGRMDIEGRIVGCQECFEVGGGKGLGLTWQTCDNEFQL